jgi:16S rRNA C967 or C1407 C5-methylase (RsmB/RsmF family)
LLNPHSSASGAHAGRGSSLSPELAGLPAWAVEGCALLDAPEPPERDAGGLLSFYPLDAASILPPRVLEPRPGEVVADLCAAPGGKALLLIQALDGRAELWLNDRSLARRRRLLRVLDDYVPAGARGGLRVTGHDATRWGLHHPGRFDAFLVDAPCSSERHVLAQPAELERWSFARIRRLAQQQYAILASAARALKPGGRIVYSTCALAPDENDGVIERIVRSKKHALVVEHPAFLIEAAERVAERRAAGQPGPVGLPALGIERTSHGFRILPDRGGFGPMYVAMLRKRG